MTQEKDTTETPPTPVRRGASVEKSADKADGIDRVREILLGDVVAELERRLTRLDYLIVHRNQEVQHDVRARTDVLEAHMKKELHAYGARVSQDASHLNDVVRATRDAVRDGLARIDERLTRVEERLDGAIARVDREAREQLLAQAKMFIEELERVRNELRAALMREIGGEPESFDEGGEHARAWPAPH